MAENVIIDAGFVVALLSRRDIHHRWANAQAERYPPPWKTCEGALSESFHLIGSRGTTALNALLRRGALVPAFNLLENLEAVLRFTEKYRDVPASLSDACLVRMSETFDSPVILTTDTDFRVYRRHGRQVIPCVIP
jgi:predicted nucleic acid-binding protein